MRDVNPFRVGCGIFRGKEASVQTLMPVRLWLEASSAGLFSVGLESITAEGLEGSTAENDSSKEQFLELAVCECTLPSLLRHIRAWAGRCLLTSHPSTRGPQAIATTWCVESICKRFGGNVAAHSLQNWLAKNDFAASANVALQPI